MRIGAENELPAMRSLAVVATGYGLHRRKLGTVSVIGPMRMNYGKVMSVVDVTAEVVTKLLAELGGS